MRNPFKSQLKWEIYQRAQLVRFFIYFVKGTQNNWESQMDLRDTNAIYEIQNGSQVEIHFELYLYEFISNERLSNYTK